MFQDLPIFFSHLTGTFTLVPVLASISVKTQDSIFQLHFYTVKYKLITRTQAIIHRSRVRWCSQGVSFWLKNFSVRFVLRRRSMLWL